MAKIVKVYDVEKGFTIVTNSIFREKGLSLKAKGLYCLMWSLPDNWQFSVDGLATLVTDKRDSVRSAMEELEEFRYLIRRGQTRERGRLSTADYDLYQVPANLLPLEDFASTVEHAQLNTKESSTNNISSFKRDKDTESNEDTRDTKRVCARTKRFIPPSVAEVAAYCKERGNGIDAESFVAHYETGGWVYGKNRTPIKSWKSAVVTWEKRAKEFAPAPRKEKPVDYEF